MRTSIRMTAAALALVVSGMPLNAQKTVQLSLGGTADAPRLGGGLPSGGDPIAFDKSRGVVVTIACSADLDCTRVAIAGDQATKIVARFDTSRASATIRIPGNPPQAEFAIPLTYDGKPVSPPSVGFKAAAEGAAEEDAGSRNGAPNGDEDAVPLKVLMRASCSNTVSSDADFVVRLDGTVLARPRRMPTEADKIVVDVVGDERLIPGTAVKRTTPIRTVRFSTILGEGTAASLGDLNKQSFRAVNCTRKRTELDNFADGRAEVEISVMDETGKEEKSTFDFNVAKLYSGALALGAIRSTASDPRFAKVFNGRDTVVSVSEADRDRLLYVLTYTPFIWGRRDVMRPPDTWYERFNPMVGVVLNKIPDNGVAGVTYDLLNLVYFTYGVHAARVATLDTRSGAAVGGPFANVAATVPTTKRWTFKPFYGLSVDLQGAASLLRAALTTPASGATGGGG